VVPGIERLTKTGVLFTNGATETFDTIIMATGYFSNVPNWLKVRNKNKNNNKQTKNNNINSYSLVSSS
jgi:lysine/ornithine N-monooxygenase